MRRNVPMTNLVISLVAFALFLRNSGDGEYQ